MDVDHGPTVLAHQMMMRDFFLHLEKPASGTEMSLAYQPKTDEQLQSPVHGRHIHIGEGLLHPGAYLLGAQMTVLSAKDVPHQRPLRRQSIALLLKSAGGMVSHRWYLIVIAMVSQ